MNDSERKKKEGKKKRIQEGENPVLGNSRTNHQAAKSGNYSRSYGYELRATGVSRVHTQEELPPRDRLDLSQLPCAAVNYMQPPFEPDLL